jgi:hypothetical protein
MPIQQVLDANYRPVSSSTGLYDPVSGSYVAPLADQTLTAPDNTVYSAQRVTVGSHLPFIVQKANNTSTGSVASLSKAFASSNITGNTIVVVAGCGNGTAMTVADSQGNTYTQAVNAPNSTTFEAAIFFAVNILPGANTVTVTNAGSAASMSMQIYEVNGVLNQVTAQPDFSSSGTGTGTTASTSALAGSVSNCIAFLGVAVGTAAQAVSATSGTNWTLDSSQNSGGTAAGLFTFGSLSQSLPAMVPVVPKATIASSEPWAAASAIFRPVALPIQGTVTIAGYNYTHITADATTLVKAGPGILHAIVINTHGVSATIEFDDALTHTNPMGIITLPSTITSAIPISLEYDVQFSTGLSITTGTATVDITVIWK